MHHQTMNVPIAVLVAANGGFPSLRTPFQGEGHESYCTHSSTSSTYTAVVPSPSLYTPMRSLMRWPA